MVHGWPGSVWEFYKIIPMLTDPASYGGKDDDAFEVIAPSIPGYGFSEAPQNRYTAVDDIVYPFFQKCLNGIFLCTLKSFDIRLPSQLSFP